MSFQPRQSLSLSFAQLLGCCTIAAQIEHRKCFKAVDVFECLCMCVAPNEIVNVHMFAHRPHCYLIGPTSECPRPVGVVGAVSSLSRSRRSHSSPRLGKELSEQEESECECVREG